MYKKMEDTIPDQSGHFPDKYKDPSKGFFKSKVVKHSQRPLCGVMVSCKVPCE